MVTNFLQKYHLQNHQLALPKKQFVTYALYALIAVAFLHYLLFYPAPASEKPVVVAQVQEEEAAAVVSARVDVDVDAHQQLLAPPPRQGDEVLRNQQPKAGADGRRRKLVAVTTFSPAHFEGDWDKAGACPKKRPYRSRERELGYTEAEMRRTVVEAVRAAADAAGAAGSGLRFAALDVTALANLRPDGHPGPYMHSNPFAAGGGVQNDCVHWCMPGPVDTFNEILLQNILR